MATFDITDYYSIQQYALLNTIQDYCSVGDSVVIPWSDGTTTYQVKHTIIGFREVSNPTIEDTTRTTTEVWLQWRQTLPFNICINEYDAMFNGHNGLKAGKYFLYVKNTIDTLKSGYYTFELTTELGNDSILCAPYLSYNNSNNWYVYSYKNAYTKDYTEKVKLYKASKSDLDDVLPYYSIDKDEVSYSNKIYSLTSTLNKAASELISATTEADKTRLKNTIASTKQDIEDLKTYDIDLGTWKIDEIGDRKLNSINNSSHVNKSWSSSFIRQYLNSTSENGIGWKSQNDYNFKPYDANVVKGFLTGYPDELVSVLKYPFVKIDTKNDKTIDEDDRVFLTDSLRHQYTENINLSLDLVKDGLVISDTVNNVFENYKETYDTNLYNFKDETTNEYTFNLRSDLNFSNNVWYNSKINYDKSINSINTSPDPYKSMDTSFYVVPLIVIG